VTGSIWTGHTCKECGARARLIGARITVVHRSDCLSRPGGPRWNAALDRLRALTRGQDTRYRQ